MSYEPGQFAALMRVLTTEPMIASVPSATTDGDLNEPAPGLIALKRSRKAPPGVAFSFDMPSPFGSRVDDTPRALVAPTCPRCGVSVAYKGYVCEACRTRQEYLDAREVVADAIPRRRKVAPKPAPAPRQAAVAPVTGKRRISLVDDE